MPHQQQQENGSPMALVNIGTWKKNGVVRDEYTHLNKTVRLQVGQPFMFPEAEATHLCELYGKSAQGGDGGLRLVNIHTGVVQGEDRRITFGAVQIGAGDEAAIPTHQMATDGLPPHMEKWDPFNIRQWADEHGFVKAFVGAKGAGSFALVERLREFIRTRRQNEERRAGGVDSSTVENPDEVAKDGGVGRQIGSDPEG